MFLAFQYPEEIPGVPVAQFLRQALSARRGMDLSVLELRVSIMEWMKRLGMDPSFGDRYLNEGFSGGEKKRNEILQLAILEPELAILDETDSGLDIDALGVVARGVEAVRQARPELGVLVVTHYQRILEQLQPALRPPADRRAHRHQRRPRAGPPPGGGRVRGMALDVTTIKKDFPILERQVHGRRLVYLDSASSSQKPVSVIDAMTTTTRPPTPTCTGASTPSPRRPPRLFEAARVGAGPLHRGAHPSEVVFTKNVTEAINLVAYSWGRANLGAGRRGGAHRDGAPRQPGPVADAQGRAGHRAAVPAAHRRRPAGPVGPGPHPRRRQAARRVGRVQRARHHQPDRASWPTPPTPPAP